MIRTAEAYREALRDDGWAGREAHMPDGLCRTRQFGGLSVSKSIRRGRRADGAGRRADPVGGRVLLPPYPSRPTVRATLHRHSAFPCVLRLHYVADIMIGAAMWNARQTGLDKLQPVREKRADLVCYREGINAHLTSAIALAQRSPAGLLMPHQSMLYAGRVSACSNLLQMMHIARELCGGQICVTRTPRRSRPREPRTGWRILHPERTVGGRGSPQASGVRAGSAELRLRRASADVRPVRPGTALQSSGCRLQRFRFRRAAPVRAQGGVAVGQGRRHSGPS
jgi:hypothetical protein